MGVLRKRLIIRTPKWNTPVAEVNTAASTKPATRIVVIRKILRRTLREFASFITTSSSLRCHTFKTGHV